MENKQTAVEWLEEQINLTFYVAEASEMNKRFKIVFKKAKIIEQDQAIDFASKVLNKAECSFTGIVRLEESIIDIYEDTYGKAQ